MRTATASATTTVTAAATDLHRLSEPLSELTLIRRTVHRTAVALLIWSLRRSASTDHAAYALRHRNEVALQQREHRALLLEPHLAHRH